MINKDFNSILELINTFDTEEKCIKHLEELRRNGNPVSPFDESSKVYKCANNKYKCKNTGKYFNVKTATIFDNTKMPLQKRFVAIFLVTWHKKGISSLQLGRDLDITQKSAWFMLQRIRECFGMTDTELDGEVEVDETYVGWKNKNRHAHKKIEASQGRSLKDKSAIMWMVQRGGSLIAKKVDDVQAMTLTCEIIKHVKESAKVYTDERLGYKSIKKIYDHSVIKHNCGEYVKESVHTNTIEWFRSLLKRGIVGIYHSISKKHMQRYINEFVFRYNSREVTECQRFNMLLAQCANRLTYNQLTNG